MKILYKLFKLMLTIILVIGTGGLWLIVMFFHWIFKKKNTKSYSDFYTYFVAIINQQDH